MSPTWATFLFEAANFLLLAAVLGWAFFRPVRSALERRRAALEAEREQARAAREEAERLLAAARREREQLEAELAALRRRMREEVERERQRLLEEALKQAEREREALAAELAGLRRSVARELARDGARAARDIVVRLLERIGGPDLERALREHARRELERLAARGPVAPLQVETAAPLDGDALGALARAAGVEPGAVRVRENPELVAGLRVITASGLVDASVAGIAAVVEQALVAELEREEGTGG